MSKTNFTINLLVEYKLNPISLLHTNSYILHPVLNSDTIYKYKHIYIYYTVNSIVIYVKHFL